MPHSAPRRTARLAAATTLAFATIAAPATFASAAVGDPGLSVSIVPATEDRDGSGTVTAGDVLSVQHLVWFDGQGEGDAASDARVISNQPITSCANYDDPLTPVANGSVKVPYAPSLLSGNVSICISEVTITQQMIDAGSVSITSSVTSASLGKTTDVRTVAYPLSLSPYPFVETADDTATTPADRSVTINPLSNDKAGPGATLVGVGESISDVMDNRLGSLTIEGQGTFTSNKDGTLLFVPDPSFVGETDPIYTRSYDSTGGYFIGAVTVEVTEPVKVGPTTADDSASGAYGTKVVAQVLKNDTTVAGDAPIDPASLRLVNSSGDSVTSLTVDEGVLTVENGGIAFVSTSGFSGTTPSFTYRVADTQGDASTGKVTFSIAERVPSLPVANADSVTLAGDQVSILVAPLANDTANGGALDASTLRLKNASGESVTSVTTDKGTFSVEADGIRFTRAAASSAGETSATYVVTDAEGDSAESTITVTLEAPAPSPTPTSTSTSPTSTASPTSTSTSPAPTSTSTSPSPTSTSSPTATSTSTSPSPTSTSTSPTATVPVPTSTNPTSTSPSSTSTAPSSTSTSTAPSSTSTSATATSPVPTSTATSTASPSSTSSSSSGTPTSTSGAPTSTATSPADPDKPQVPTGGDPTREESNVPLVAGIGALLTSIAAGAYLMRRRGREDRKH